MRLTTVFLSLLLVCIWTIGGVAANDEKKVIKKNVWVQKSENKAGLGIMVTNVDSEDPDSQKDGAQVVEVFKGSEAERIGLKKGDVIVEIDGKSINKPSDLVDIFDDVEEGTEVKLKVKRESGIESLTAKLKPFEGNTYAYRVNDEDGDILVDVYKTPGPDKNFSVIRSSGINATTGGKGGYLGVQVKELSSQLKEYFEVKNGVLVEEVMKDSPAEKTGLKAGDVIVSISDRKIEDYHDLIRTVNYFDPEEEVSISYVRKGDTEKSKVVLGKKPEYQRINNKMKGHKSLQFIDEDGEHNLLITGESSGKAVWVEEDGPKVNIEIKKEFIIL
jgi:C-terminal processing protease CtpA/Prc